MTPEPVQGSERPLREPEWPNELWWCDWCGETAPEGADPCQFCGEPVTRYRVVPEAQIVELKEAIRDYERAVRKWINAPPGAMLSRRREERNESRNELFALLSTDQPEGE